MSLPTDLRFSLRRNVRLSQYTTMQVGGEADFFAEPSDEEELLEILDFFHQRQIPWVLLGKGSNTVFLDEGFRGAVISFLRFEHRRISFHRDLCEVTVSAGVPLYQLALVCRKQGFGGVEFLAGIPGTVGGALLMNAGFSRYPGQVNEIGDLVQEVTVLTPDGEKHILSRQELCFRYRWSSLESFIILEAKLRLWRKAPQEIEQEMAANFAFRNAKQDLRYPSSGSVFKNPPPPLPPAAVLIDQLGLKGKCRGGIQVSPRHSNFFIKVGPARSSDLLGLISEIQNTVFNATQILLEPELKIIKGP